MSRGWKVVLILVAAACFAVALSYPIRYSIEQRENDDGMARLAAIRRAGLEREEATESAPKGTAWAAENGVPHASEEATGHPETTADRRDDAPTKTIDAADNNPREAVGTIPNVPEATSTVNDAPTETIGGVPKETAGRTRYAPEPTLNPTPVSTPLFTLGPVGDTETTLTPVSTPTFMPGPTVKAETTLTPVSAPSPTPTVAPTPTPDRRLRTGKAQPYPEKEKVVFDEADILPEFRELYEINSDLVGWIAIPDTVIDYPVVQSGDSEFYLEHDFYGEKNSNGQIILDAKCDPYTPSYNLVVSGHNMKSGSMFGSLVNYANESYWKRHRTLEMDVLTEHREYVVFAAFFSADYDVDEEGFRYNVDIQYQLDMRKWLEEIRANELYETGVDVAFGDEFLTLTTCNHSRRKDGRFVLVCRRIREGEKIE